VSGVRAQVPHSCSNVSRAGGITRKGVGMLPVRCPGYRLRPGGVIPFITAERRVPGLVTVLWIP
jgi:hypothetical protein